MGSQTLNKKISVLIVDDEPEVCEIIAEQFKILGWQPHTCENAEEALNYLSSRHIDVVLTDIRMPGDDGIQLVQKIRETAAKNLIVIFMTGFRDISKEQAQQAGANALVYKPINAAQLVKLARELGLK